MNALSTSASPLAESASRIAALHNTVLRISHRIDPLLYGEGGCGSRVRGAKIVREVHAPPFLWQWIKFPPVRELCSPPEVVSPLSIAYIHHTQQRLHPHITSSLPRHPSALNVITMNSSIPSFSTPVSAVQYGLQVQRSVDEHAPARPLRWSEWSGRASTGDNVRRRSRPRKQPSIVVQNNLWSRPTLINILPHHVSPLSPAGLRRQSGYKSTKVSNVETAILP